MIAAKAAAIRGRAIVSLPNHACQQRAYSEWLASMPLTLPALAYFAFMPLSTHHARTVANIPRLYTLINPQPGATPALMMVDGDDDGAADLALLSRRIDELKSVHKMQALCLPEVLLPGQRMHLPLMPAQFADLALRANGTVCATDGADPDGGDGAEPDGGAEVVLGVLGMHMGRVLSHGVRARVTELRREFGDAGHGDACRWSCTLVGGQVFERTMALEMADVPTGLVFTGEVCRYR